MAVSAVSFSAVGYTPIPPLLSTSLLNFLSSPSVQLQRMKLEDFIRNLRGIDNNRDLDEEMLTGIYERIRNQEFRPGTSLSLRSQQRKMIRNDAKC